MAQNSEPRTNATVELLVSEEANIPTDNNAKPAIQYPKYVAKITPQSGLPIILKAISWVVENNSAMV